MAIVARRPAGWPRALIAETVPFAAVAKIYAAGGSARKANAFFHKRGHWALWRDPPRIRIRDLLVTKHALATTEMGFDAYRDNGRGWDTSAIAGIEFGRRKALRPLPLLSPMIQHRGTMQGAIRDGGRRWPAGRRLRSARLRRSAKVSGLRSTSRRPRPVAGRSGRSRLSDRSARLVAVPVSKRAIRP
jgi:hypothetical protein